MDQLNRDMNISGSKISQILHFEIFIYSLRLFGSLKVKTKKCVIYDRLLF